MTISQTTQKFFQPKSQNFEHYSRYNSKVQKSKLVKKMNIIARKTQKLKTAKSENNEHYS